MLVCVEVEIIEHFEKLVTLEILGSVSLDVDELI
jgi:hypothetical protein